MALNMDLINKTAQGAVGDKYKLVQTTPKPLKIDMSKVTAAANSALASQQQNTLKTPTLRVSGGGAANEGAGAGVKPLSFGDSLKYTAEKTAALGNKLWGNLFDPLASLGAKGLSAISTGENKENFANAAKEIDAKKAERLAQEQAIERKYDTGKVIKSGATGMDLINATMSGGNQALGGIYNAIGAVDTAASNIPLVNKALNLPSNYVSGAYDTGEGLNAEAAKTLADAKMNANGVGSKVLDISQAAGNMLFASGMGKGFTGGALKPVLQKTVGLATLGTSAGGNAASEAKQGGASAGQALAYGALVGATEALTEKLFGGNPLFDNDAGLINKLIGKITKSPKLLKFLSSVPVEMLNEGTEEALSTILQPLYQRLTYDPNASFATLSEIADSYIDGVILAGVMQGGNAIAQGAKAKPLVTPQLTTQTQQSAQPVKPVDLTPKTTQTVKPTSDTTAQPFAEISVEKPIQNVATQNANIGYHFGDLGKADHLSMMSGRDTGHFGTGTYFFGSESADGYNEYSKMGRPRNVVDFTGYNLYRPQSKSDGESLHSLLKDVNDFSLSSVSPDILDAVIAGIADENFIQQLAFDKYPKTAEMDFAEETANDDLLDSDMDPISLIRELQKREKPVSPSVKERAQNIDSYVSSANKIVGKIASITDGLKSRFGMSDSQIKSVLKSILQYGNSGVKSGSKGDSPSTVLMKQLGYDGIDVRGISGLDNSAYGSVIYDVKRNNATQTGAQSVTAQPVPARQAAKTVDIQDRNFSNVGDRSVKAFQFEYPELHDHYSTAATYMQYDLDLTTKGERKGIKDADGYYVSSWGTKRKTNKYIEKLLDDANLSYDQIAKALDNIIQNHGQENYAAAKKVEVVLDEILSKGYETLDGMSIPADADYISARDKITGVQTQSISSADTEDLPIANKERLQAVNAPSDTLTSNPTQSVGAATAGWNPYNQLLNQYGAIPEGEGPIADTRVVSVPKQTSDDEYVMQTMRTAQEAPATPDSLVPDLEQAVLDNLFSKKRKSDIAALYYAEEAIRSKGYSTALKDWTADVRKGTVSKELTALGWTLYNNAANSGNAKEAVDILVDLSSMVRSGAQAVQAVRLLKKMAPESRLYAVQRSVQNLQDELAGKYGKDAPNLKIDADLADKFINAKTDAERNAALREIYRNIGSQLPSTFGDRFNAWRYLSMLGNVRTHVRNIGSNFVFAGVRSVKNAIAKGLETAVIGDKEGRTKAFLTVADKALIEAAYADYATVADEVTAYGKYNEAQDEIQRGRKIFKLKPLEAARNFNNTALDTEDVWVSRPAYARALAGYMKANGITADMLKSGSTDLDRARAYAVNEARKASFRDSNAFSDMVSSIGKQGGKDKSFIQKATNVVVEGIMPFKRTPANILVRAFEYSPIGLAKGITEYFTQVKNNNMTAAQALDNISSGLTGTLVVGLGAMLASMGLISGGGSDDDKEKSFDELQGAQDYSLMIGDTAFSIDWLSPSAVPLFVGVEIFNKMVDNSEAGVKLKDVLDAISKITNPVLETSMLQSLNDVLSNVSYADAPLYYMLSSTVTSYLGQVVPTLGGQIARTIDDTRRTTYVDKNSGVPDELQYFAQKTLGKVPFANQNAQPYVDMWGREEVNANPLSRAVQNLVSPSYVSKLGSSDMEKELQRLYDIDSASGVLPSKAPKYVEDKGTRYDMTAAEYTQYKKTRGQSAYNTLTELTASKEYRALSDAGKADVIKDAHSYAAEKAKDELLTSRKVKHETAAIVTELDGAVKNKITPTQFLTTKRLYTAPPATETQTGAELQAKKLTPLLTPNLGKYVKETKTQESAADLARLNLLQRKDLTVKQKSYLDTALIGELKAPIDYTNEDKFILSTLTAPQQKKYATVKERLGFTPRQYSVYLSAMSKDKDAESWKQADKINALKAAGLSQSDAFMFIKIMDK